MAGVEETALGATGLKVPRLGLGCQPLGSPTLADSAVASLLDVAVDLGVRLFDTAPAYELSEERLGRHLAGRRSQVVLVTKLGYGVQGVADWTGECIRRGVEAALARLQTDRIDIALLHSCDLDTLRRGDVVEALIQAREEGKIRLAGYSGENEALAFAISSGAFQVIETSVNFLDQRSLGESLNAAHEAGLGVLAKRPLANAVWRDNVSGDAAVQEYRRRFLALRSQLDGDFDWPDLALRFSAFASGVDCAMIGTTREAHLRAAVSAIEAGPLAVADTERLVTAWNACGIDWPGVI